MLVGRTCNLARMQSLRCCRQAVEGPCGCTLFRLQHCSQQLVYGPRGCNRGVQQQRVSSACQEAAMVPQPGRASCRGSSISPHHKSVPFQRILQSSLLPPGARPSSGSGCSSARVRGRLHAFPRHHHDDGVAAQEHLGHDAVPRDGLAAARGHLLPDLAHVFEDPAAAGGGIWREARGERREEEGRMVVAKEQAGIRRRWVMSAVVWRGGARDAPRASAQLQRSKARMQRAALCNARRPVLRAGRRLR